MPIILPLLLLFALTSACSRIAVQDYQNFQPVLVPEVFFAGYLTAHGVVKDRGGRVIRTFNADIDASWKNGIGTLVEDFVFNDGEIQQRVWTLTPQGNGRYSGVAGDVIGTGELALSGNSLFLDYALRVPYGDSSVDVRVDDRMYLISPDVLINESSLKKFGVRVGSLDLVILRQPGEAPNKGAQGDDK